MFWRTLLTMVATTTMLYHYSISLGFRQDIFRARGLFVVRKSQQGVRGGGNLAPCFLIFLHQEGRIWFKEDTQ